MACPRDFFLLSDLDHSTRAVFEEMVNAYENHCTNGGDQPEHPRSVVMLQVAWLVLRECGMAPDFPTLVGLMAGYDEFRILPFRDLENFYHFQCPWHRHIERTKDFVALSLLIFYSIPLRRRNMCYIVHRILFWRGHGRWWDDGPEDPAYAALLNHHGFR